MSMISSDPDLFQLSLRVLAVDDDPTFLSILGKMLEECEYRVTKCSSGMAALQLLREKEHGFDLIICEVHMAEMGGLELFECADLMIAAPFILMSADKSKSVVSEGLACGACDYLIKPISIEPLKTIWLHVVQLKQLRQKRIEDQRAEESEDYSLDDDDLEYAPQQMWEFDPNIVEEDMESGCTWTPEIQRQFVGAINQLGGIDKAIPSRIVKLMNTPNLTLKYLVFKLHEYWLHLAGRCMFN